MKEDRYFPVFINISEKKILVIGGGNVAARRINTLLLFAENILVVSPELDSSLEVYVKQGKIRWIRDHYQKEYLEGMDIVLAATDDRTVNIRITEDVRILKSEKEKAVLLNVADNQKECDFFFPSVVCRDEIVVGINSGGKNPQKVSKTRKSIEQFL